MEIKDKETATKEFYEAGNTVIRLLKEINQHLDDFARLWNESMKIVEEKHKRGNL